MNIFFKYRHFIGLYLWRHWRKSDKTETGQRQQRRSVGVTDYGLFTHGLGPVFIHCATLCIVWCAFLESASLKFLGGEVLPPGSSHCFSAEVTTLNWQDVWTSYRHGLHDAHAFHFGWTEEGSWGNWRSDHPANSHPECCEGHQLSRQEGWNCTAVRYPILYIFHTYSEQCQWLG